MSTLLVAGIALCSVAIAALVAYVVKTFVGIVHIEDERIHELEDDLWG